MSKLLLYLRTDTFRKNLIGAMIALALLFLGVYFGLQWYTKHGVSIEVPQVKGLHIDDAIQTLEKADLEYSIDYVYQMDAKPGLVMEQDPDPKSQVKTGRTIYLTIITETPPEVAFPDIIDKTFIEASAILRNQSLKIADTVYVADIARDVVLDVKFGGQPLKAGRPIPKGSQITLVLGNGQGADDIEVPNLIGLSLPEARFALSGVGLSLGNITYSGVITDSLSSTIVFQQPDTTAGFVSMGSAVNVTLAN
ncbi:PASTA domain-containing protein [Sphingobacterium corticibacterium]|uniref:PASTA domain-containing protein n=1 Tax=Sphingobacterium corticibacterium TaxID=2484746 RepID=A0A4V2DBW4_9SPHI|nr:PASTA domain-containing protein [Sphingobacterium corticibacterium]RZF59398.1 PASTA domain-containing protein [Sphingobacterium corticibacterium]